VPTHGIPQQRDTSFSPAIQRQAFVQSPPLWLFNELRRPQGERSSSLVDEAARTLSILRGRWSQPEKSSSICCRSTCLTHGPSQTRSFASFERSDTDTNRLIKPCPIGMASKC
jgi:hypothetical protein